MAKFSAIKKREPEIKYDPKETVICGERVFIKQRLSALMMNKLILEVVETSFLGKTYSPFLYEVGFTLAVITYYTDIVFTKSEQQNPLTTFDEIETRNIYEEVIYHIAEEEMNTLIELLEETIEEQKLYKRSLSGIVYELLEQIPELSKLMAETISNVEKTGLQKIVTNGQEPSVKK